jgi:threonine/homoserine efflux transporter RhtA
MINAIGWLIVAWVVMVVGKAIAKIIFPEDWE